MEHLACQSLEEHHVQLHIFLSLVFQYFAGPGQFVEQEKLEYVAHLTNYSKLVELRIGKLALSSLLFYIVCYNVA